MDPRRAILVLIPVFLVFLLSLWLFGEPWGFPLDDPYIHLQYAKNVIRGCVFCYNEGELSNGTTSFLWPILLSPLTLLPDLLMKLSVYLVGFLLLLGTYTVLKRILPSNRLDLLLINGLFVFHALSGMETPLYLFVLSLLLVSLKKRSPLISAAVSGLAVYSRFAFLAGVPAVLLYQKTAKDKLLFLTVVSAITLPLFLYNVYVTGRPFPATFYVKRDPYRTLEAFTNPFPFGWIVPVILIFIPVILLALRHPYSLLLGFLALGHLTYGALPGGSGMFRWYMDVILLEYLAILEKTPEKLLKWFLALHIITVPVFSSFWALYVTEINNQQVLLGHVFHEVLPKDVVIGLNDVGAMKFYSGLRIVDIVGLVTPETTFLEDRIGYVLKEGKADFLATYSTDPRLRPYLCGAYSIKTANAAYKRTVYFYCLRIPREVGREVEARAYSLCRWC